MTRTSGPVKWIACALALLAVPTAALAQAPARYAGVEIGGRGVKATVVEVPADPTTATVRFEDTITTNISDFDDGRLRPAAVARSVNAVLTLRTRIHAEFGIAPADVVVVGSSGVALATNKEVLAAAVETATGKRMDYITVEREAELALRGLVLSGLRDDALLIDIGGGNTKGGVFAGGRFVPYSVPLGAQTFATKVKAAGGSFLDAARSLAPADLLTPLTAQAAPVMTERRTVYAVGGVVWAAATYAHPEQAARPLVPLTEADVDAFLAKVGGGVVPELDVSGVTDEAARKAALADAAVIRRTDPEQLIAGAVILKSAFAVLKVQGKDVYFARKGKNAWITALVVPPAAKVVARPPVPACGPRPFAPVPYSSYLQR